MHGAGGESEHAADTTRVRGARKGGLANALRRRTGDTPWLLWEAARGRLAASRTSATPVARERAPTRPHHHDNARPAPQQAACGWTRTIIVHARNTRSTTTRSAPHRD